MTIVLAFLKGYWSQVALGLALAAALTAAAWNKSHQVQAELQRDVARTELAGTQVALEAEKASTLAAVGAADRCSAQAADQDRRCASVISDAQAESARYRAQLGRCQTVGALIERFNAIDGDL